MSDKRGHNLIRERFVLTTHAGMLLPNAEEMQNWKARQDKIWYDPSVLASKFMYVLKTDLCLKAFNKQIDPTIDLVIQQNRAQFLTSRKLTSTYDHQSR